MSSTNNAGTTVLSPLKNRRIRDVRPLVERNETNGLSQAEIVRDQIYNHFVQASNEKNVDVLILKSPPFTSPPWVRVECWIHHSSDPALTLRSAAQLSVRPREYFRFSYEIDMVISNDKRSRTFRSIIAFDKMNAEKVLNYLLFESQSYSFGLQRCRVWPLQFWLPSNKPARLGVDPMSVVAQICFLLGIATVVFGIGVVFLLIGGILAYSNGKRRRHILSTGKPAQEPRRLIRLDSWQTLVRSLGTERDIVVAAIRGELAKVTEESFVLVNEKIWYWGVDGKEEREQLVVRFRRGIAFVHIYQYDEDLFVGWDAHVNCGAWIEQVAGGGYDKTTQELCSVHTIAAGWHVPNEYDITDTNCLLERVHTVITQVIKLKLAEHQIDQEIDFKILREPRQSIVGREAEAGGVISGGIQNVLSKVRRIG
jgi:hypothetical protein